MFAGSVVVAQKEMVDHFRDTRALLSTALYTLMGPLVVGALATSTAMDNMRLSIMASVFVMVAAFTGGMSVATDTIAGERERRSLLPLILNSNSSLEILGGKWLAAWIFALASSMLTVAAFVVLLLCLPRRVDQTVALDLSHLPWAMPALATLAALAAALEILFSVTARNVKEATTYVSMLTFLAMGVGMWFALRPQPGHDGWLMVPISGHQRALQFGFGGQDYGWPEAMVLSSITAAAALLVLVQAARLFRRNEVDYRN